MKEIKINIKTENEAFESTPQYEIERILKEIIKKGIFPRKLYDINGNPVGEIKIID